MGPPEKSHRQVTLHETLRPLLWITFYGGLLPDWSKLNRGWNWANRTTVSLYLILLLSTLAFQLYQVALALVGRRQDGETVDIPAIVNQIIWFAGLPLALWTLTCTLRHRKKYVGFFEDWANFEADLSPVCVDYKFHFVTYVLYCLIGFASLVLAGFEIFSDPYAPQLMSSYEAVRETISPRITSSICLFVQVVVWSLMLMTDAVPSFVYSHLGGAISSIEQDLRVSFDRFHSTAGTEVTLGDSILGIWSRFEQVCKFVDRANQLFGTMLVGAHGFYLFSITAFLYFTFFSLSRGGTHVFDPSICMLNVMGLAFCLTAFSFLAARVNQSACRLRTTLLDLLSQHWKRIPKEDRDILVTLLSRLQQSDRVAACPSNLYDVSPSFLLTFSGLAFSYVIILLQS